MNRRLCAWFMAAAMLLSLPKPAGAAGLNAERSEETGAKLEEPVSEGREAEDTAEDAEAMLETENATEDEEAVLLTAEGTCGEEVNWKLDDNGALVISGTGKMNDYSSSNPPPWSANKESIRTLEIQEGVTSIGSSAFNGCTKLVSASVKSNLTTIGASAFNNCSALASVTLPLALRTIGSYAFYGCSALRDVFYGAKYGNNSYYSYSWNSITIGSHNDPLNEATFHGGGATAVASGVCGSQAYWMLDSNGLFVVSGSGAMKEFEDHVAPWYENISKIQTVIIREGITQVIDAAFDSCTSLNKLTLPASLTEIKEYAFYNCSRLSSVDYAGSYEDWNKITISAEGNSALFAASAYYKGSEAGVAASGSCGSDARWTLDVNGTLTISGSGTVNKRPHRSDIPIEILSVVIEEGITSLRATGSVTSYYSSSGSNRIIDLFQDFKSMKEISIPGSVVEIEKSGGGIFEDCIALTTVTVSETSESFVSPDNVLFSKDMTRLVACPPGKEDAAYEIPETVTEIDPRAFYNSKIQNVVLPDGLTAIADYMFARAKLTEAVIPKSVTKLGYGVFSNCDNLVSVTIPESITKLEYSTFYSCDNLASISLPATVTIIGNSCFAYCASLVNVLIPEGVTSLGTETFSNCSKLESIVFPKSLTSFGSSLFYYCSNLKDLYYNGTESDWTEISESSRQVIPSTVSIHYTDGTSGSFCTVYFYSEGRLSSSKVVRAGDSYGDLPVPTREGYKFLGWFTKSEGGDQITTATIATAGSNHSFYAHWNLAGSPVSGVRLNKSSLILEIGGSDTVTATVLPEDAVNKGVTWRSSNSEIATAQGGVVTAVAPGNATIEAVTQESGFTAICLVTVQDTVIKVTDFSLNRSQISSLAVGTSISLTATITPAYATNRSVSWSTSAYDVALVSESGVVTAVGPGNATITATAADGGFTASCTVMVPESREPTGLKVEAPENTEIVQGSLLNVPGLKVYALYGEEEEAIANYSVSGYDRNALGQQTVTASFRDKSATFSVTVVPRTVTKLTLLQRPAKLEYAIGEPLDLTGLVIRVDYNDNSNERVTSSAPFEISGFDANSAESRIVTLSMGEKSVSYPVQVREADQIAEVAAPRISISDVYGGKQVEFTATQGCAIYYTLDGSVPTTESEIYAEPLLVDDSKTVKAIAVQGESKSAVSFGRVSVLKLEAPRAAYANESQLPAGTVVQLDSMTSGATIYYTTDGSEPTIDTGIRYGSGIIVNEDITIQAVTMREGSRNSDILTVSYTVSYAEAATRSNAVISIGSVLSRAGESLSAPVYVFTEGDEQVTDFRFVVSYAPDTFAYASLTPAEEMPASSLMVSADNSGGEITVLYSGQAIAGGEMFALNLMALDSSYDGEYELGVSQDVITVKTDAGTPLVSTVSGVITLEGSHNSQLGGEMAIKDSRTGDDVTRLSAETAELSASIALDAAPMANTGSILADVFLAVYDRKGMMVSLDSWNVELTDISSVFMHSIYIPSNVEVGAIKLMILSEDMSPLMASTGLSSV